MEWLKIGLFTDSYFPQVSGVATSIKTLKDQLERLGNEVYIFTTTDPNVAVDDPQIIRMPSVPFISFTDRRIVVRGMIDAYQIAKEKGLDLIHTQTEFGVGLLGQLVARKLKIPVIHTYHTMYEDYLHYIAKGKVIRKSHVRYLTRLYANHTDAVVCPSERVSQTLIDYGVTRPLKVIPTGIELERFVRPDITPEMTAQLRKDLGIQEDQIMLLSLSRISYEKNIQAIIQGMPQVLLMMPNVRLVVVGKGPYLENLQKQVHDLGLQDYVQFTGEVENDKVAYYYRAADYFVSASTSESQGLTYTESMAAGTPIIVEGNAYLNALINHPSLGATFKEDADFAECLVEYIHSGIQPDEQILKDKLYSISADCFGDTMFAFYQQVLAEYAQKEIKTKSSSIAKIKVKLSAIKPSITRGK